MMPTIKPHLSNLFRTPPAKTSRKHFLRLDMNESVDGLSEAFLAQALKQVNSQTLSTYPEYGELIESIAGHVDIPPDRICVSNGSDAAIRYIFDAYIGGGDTVLLTDPTFAMYPIYCRMYDAHAVSLGYHDDFTFPLEEYLTAIADGPKMAVMVNPNNPTGIALEPRDLETIITHCEQAGVLLVVDEAYYYYYPETVIRHVRTCRNLIVLRTFSKLCGLAGVRIGYLAACPDIVTDIYRVKPSFDVNCLAVLLARQVLDHPDIITREIAKIEGGKTYLLRRLKQNGVEFQTGKANFILIKCPGNKQMVIDRLHQKQILVSGTFQHPFLKDYIRITVGGKQSMKRFCDVFLNILDTK